MLQSASRGGVPGPRGGVCLVPGGVAGPGGCLFRGGGCLVPGGVPGLGGYPTCTEADTPPVDRILDTRL